ncbi:MAG: LytTR family DNA-binding domain-containing protein [Niabella sp.]
MLKVIAIDDEPFALEVVKNHASKVPFIELMATFTDAFEGIAYMQNHTVDLLILDINMPDISGIELSRSLQNPPMIIFATAYSEHAVEGFELDAVDYLLKPFSLARFLKACTKAQEFYNLKNNRSDEGYMFVKDGHEQVRVDFDGILFIESAGNYLNIILQHTKITTRLTIAEMLQLLPPSDFVRIHRSYIVAKDKVSRYNKASVYIKDHELPIGMNYTF